MLPGHWKEIGRATIVALFQVVALGVLTIGTPSWAQVLEEHQESAWEDVFLEASISKKDAYVGEQVFYTIKLFYKRPVADITIDLPENENITLYQLGDPLRYEAARGGTVFEVIELRYALVCSSESVRFISPSRMNMTISRTRRQSSFGRHQDDSFFSSEGKEPVTVSSRPVEFRVVSLPKEGKPTDFSGLLGQFSLDSTLEPLIVKVGQTAILSVLIEGTGNVSRIPDMQFPETPGIKVYPDQPIIRMRRGLGGIAGSKEMKWALVPEREERFNLPMLKIDFFDPEVREYRTLVTASQTLTVLASSQQDSRISGPPSANAEAQAKRKEPVRQVGVDILPVHTGMGVLSGAERDHLGWGSFWLLFFLPVFIYTCTLASVRYKRRSAQGATAARARRAASVLLKRIRKKPFAAVDMNAAIREYLNNRFGLSMGYITPEEASQVLLAKGVAPERAAATAAILQHLEAQIYAGNQEDVFDFMEGLPDLISGVEKDLRGRTWSA